jgi:hypothetical protein
MRRGTRLIATLAGTAGVLAVNACAVAPPAGPTVMALPGQGKTFPQFQHDDYTCRGYAAQQTGYQQPGQAGTNAAVGSAVLGTALGAAAGAAIGAAAGNPGAGAAIGAATGLVGGSAVGANNAYASEAGLQQRYDIAYTQCMYANGNTVQSPPPAYAGYPAYGYPVGPYYGAGYYGPGFYGGGYYGPSVVVGFGGGWGWGGGWRRGWGGWGGGWHGGWGGWHH